MAHVAGAGGVAYHINFGDQTGKAVNYLLVCPHTQSVHHSVGFQEFVAQITVNYLHALVADAQDLGVAYEFYIVLLEQSVEHGVGGGSRIFGKGLDRQHVNYGDLVALVGQLQSTLGAGETAAADHYLLAYLYPVVVHVQDAGAALYTGDGGAQWGRSPRR